MNTKPRRDRRAFRPGIAGLPLEERVVMSAAPAWMSILRGASPGTPSSPSGPTGPSGPTSPTGLGDITARQLMTAYNQQFGATRTALQQYINDQIGTLYSSANLGANGRPTAQAIADFNSNVGGALNATAYGLSSQLALLPGSSQRLVPGLQQSLLGSGSGSLASRIAAQVNSGRGVASQRLLQNAIDRQIGTAFAMSNGQVSSLLRSPQLGRQTIDSAGQRITLSQYLGNQAALQINNTLGTLANSVSNNAQSALFDTTGAFNPQGVSAFQQQYGNALNTAAYQVNGILSVLPNSSSLRSQLQSGFFGATNGTGTGTGTPNANLFNALSGVFPTGTGTTTTPFTMDAFNTAFQNGFTTAFQNFNGPVGTFLNQTSTGSQLPTGFFQTGSTFPSVFGSQFSGSTFNNGFNNGFAATGTGFPGFGTAPTAFNTGFGTGFNGFITNVNGQAGLNIPTSTGTIGTGIGTGVTDPTGGLSTGIGTGTTGTGTGLGGVIDPTGGVSTGIGTGTSTGTSTTGTGVGTSTNIGNVGVGTNPGGTFI